MPEQRITRWWTWALGSGAIVLLDQLIKYVVERNVSEEHPIRVTAFFDLVLYYNKGAAFGFLSTASGWQRELFIALAIAASAFMLYLLRKHAADRWFCLAIALILGGAVGNVIDRFRIGKVVDFLSFHIGVHSFPAFNLADSAITCGAALLIWESLRRSKSRATDLG